MFRSTILSNISQRATRYSFKISNSAIKRLRFQSTSTNENRKKFIIREISNFIFFATGGTAISLAVFATIGASYEFLIENAEIKVPGEMINVSIGDNEYQIHMIRNSKNHPTTVILDGSIGETSFDWSKVDHQIASFANTISIDRPGLGFSSSGIIPRNAEQIAKEYVHVLKKLNITGNIILVGHGSGGYNMRLLASALQQGQVPSAHCSGIVLVDSLEEQLHKDLSNMSSYISEFFENRHVNAKRLVYLASIGFVRLVQTLQWNKEKKKYTENMQEYVKHYAPTRNHRQGIYDEMVALSETEVSFQTINPSMPHGIPLIVLSHDIPDIFHSMTFVPEITDDVLKEMELKWKDGQNRLLQNANGLAVHRVVKDTGHYIQQQKPEEIVSSVLALVNETQGHSSGGIESLVNGTCSLTSN